MSDPLSDRCLYCGSPAVLDDAWFCSRCYGAYERETPEGFNNKLRACGLTELADNSAQLSPIPGRHRDTPDPPPVARIGGQPYDPDDVPDRRDVE